MFTLSCQAHLPFVSDDIADGIHTVSVKGAALPLKSYPKHLMTAGEIATIARRTVTCIGEYIDKDPHLKDLYQDLDQGTKDIEHAINSGTDLSLNADVKQRDKERDQTITRFSGYLRGLKNHHEIQIAEAAIELYGIMSRHEFGSREKSYAEQSTMGNAMLRDMQTDKAQKALEICDAKPFYDLLSEQQNAFEKAVMARVSAVAKGSQPTVTSLLPRVRAGLTDIAGYLNSRERLYPKEYERLIAQMNAMVTDIVSKIRARKSRKGKKQPRKPPDNLI